MTVDQLIKDLNYKKIYLVGYDKKFYDEENKIIKENFISDCLKDKNYMFVGHRT